ncbi:tape measure protein [Arthrobacter sp. ISL-85]|uniref:tape measure protein n=1 Tax=Arthrobacter sp. ISL-85 TaxID=2819115 RepID=UPI001BEBF965|nr:tape measure protein [Arthrobacter sp. ISL-85]MBT2566595.1 tape measure protein [Arthrobacter sp. ISL-85]
MAVELATAYISLVPSLKGAKGAIAADLAGVDSKGIGNEMGSKIGGGLVGSMKALVVPALAVLGSGMFAGFIKDAAAASDATDKFKATMSFAGMDTGAISAAAKAAKDYADQTVYDLPTIQNMTAQLASNGVKDYTGLTQAAGNLNAVAGGNADTFKSVAMVMTQTAGAGKLTTENWNQMADAIPGAAGPLMKAMQDAGAYTGNFRDAMAAGQITSEEFNAALMKLGTDPVAVEAARSTKTFEGAIGNLQATINSGLMGALNALKPMITGTINGLAAGAGAIFDWAGNLLPGLYAIFAKGDITPGLLKALGMSEDSPIIGGLVALSDMIYSGYLKVANFIAGFKLPSPDASRLWGQLDGAARFGVVVKERIETVLFGIRQFVAGFTIPMPALLSAGVDTSGMVGIGATVRDIFNGLKDAAGPLFTSMFQLWSAVSPLGTVFQALRPSLEPILSILGSLLQVVGYSLVSAIMGVLPSIQSLQAVFVGLFMDTLSVALPLLAQLAASLGATLAQLIPVLVPIIVQVAQLAATLIGQLAPIFMQLVSAVLPMVVTALTAILGAVIPVVQMVAGLLIPIIQFLLPVVSTVFSLIANIIQSAMQIVMGIIQVVTGIISGNWAQVWEGIGNIFSGIWSWIVTLITGYFQIIGSIVMSGLGMIAGFFAPGLAAIGQFFTDTWNNIIGFLAGVWTTIAAVVSAGVAMLVAPIVAGVTAAWDFIVSIFTAVGGFISGVWNWIVSLVTNILIAFWQTHGAQLTAIWNVVVSIFNQIAGFIAGIWNGIVSLVSGLVQAWVAGITYNLNMMWGFISAIFSTVFGFVAGIWNSIVSVVGGLITAWVSGIVYNFTGLWGFISSIFGQVASFLGGIWNNIVSGVSGMIGNVVGTLAGLGGAIMGALSGAGSWLFGIGKNIVEGLMDGIKSLAGTIGNFFLSLIPGWIVGPFKAALGIASPSKLFRGFGRNIGEGVILGAGDMKADITSTMTNLVDIPSAASLSPYSLPVAAAGADRAGVTNNWTINQVDDPVGTAHAIARRQNRLAV